MLNWGVMLRDFLCWWAQLVRSLLAGCALVRTRFANPLVVPVGVEARWRVVAKLQHELMQAVPRMLIDDLRLWYLQRASRAQRRRWPARPSPHSVLQRRAPRLSSAWRLSRLSRGRSATLPGLMFWFAHSAVGGHRCHGYPGARDNR